MKQYFINFENGPKNHLVYLYYLIDQIKKNNPNVEITCSCIKDFQYNLKSLLNITCCNRYSQMSTEYKKNLSCIIEWKKNAAQVKIKQNKNTTTIVFDNNSKLKAKKTQDVKTSDSILDNVQIVLDYFNIKPQRPQYYWQDVPKSIVLKQIINGKLNKSKHVVYLDIYSSEHQPFYPFYKYFIKKCIQSNMFSLLIRVKNDADFPYHPDCVYLPSTLVFSDHVHLVKIADTFVGASGDFDHFAAVFNKPIYLFLADTIKRKINITGFKCVYFNSFILRPDSFVDKDSVNHQANACYSIFLNFLETISLNEKLTAEELRYRLFLINNPTGIIFENDYEKTKWNKKNIDIAHLVEPVDKVLWKKWSKRMILVEKKSLNCLIGGISLTEQILTSLWVLIKYKKNLLWLRQSVNDFLPFSYWIASLLDITQLKHEQ